MSWIDQNLSIWPCKQGGTGRQVTWHLLSAGGQWLGSIHSASLCGGFEDARHVIKGQQLGLFKDFWSKASFVRSGVSCS